MLADNVGLKTVIRHHIFRSGRPTTKSKLSSIKVILCRFSTDRLDRLLFAISPVLENMLSSGMDDDGEDGEDK